MVCAPPSFAHVTGVNANRWYAEDRFDVVAALHADAVDEGLQDWLDAVLSAALDSGAKCAAQVIEVVSGGALKRLVVLASGEFACAGFECFRLLAERVDSGCAGLLGHGAGLERTEVSVYRRAHLGELALDDGKLWRATGTGLALRNIGGACGHFPPDHNATEVMMDDHDKHRFERLYRENFERVAAYLLSRADRGMAEDALARTFEIAWRRFADVPLEPLPWLLGVARRVLSDLRRGEGRRDALIERIADTLAPSGGDHADALTARHQVLAALQSLTEIQREVLLLVAWDGLSQREAAAMLGCSRGAVALRLHRARARISAATAGESLARTRATLEPPTRRSRAARSVPSIPPAIEETR